MSTICVFVLGLQHVSDCESLLAVLKGVVLIVSGVMILAAMYV